MSTLYYYEAIGASGERVTGELEAESRQAVTDQLNRTGNFVIDIREADGAVRSELLRTGRSAKSALKRSQVTALIRELGMLVGAGLPLADALRVIAGDARSDAFKKAATGLEAALGDGKSFHEALMSQPGSFDAFTVNMVRVGEASGTLPVVLTRIADAREREEKIRSKLWSAMMYPAFLVATAIIAVAIMLGFVVPSFKALIVNARVEIPTETAIIIALSDWLRANGGALALVVTGTFIALTLLSGSPGVRRSINSALANLPVIGNLIRLNMNIRFCGGLGTLLECGVELPRALTLTRDLFHDQKLGPVINEAYETLRKGQDFTVPLEASGLFQPVAVSMFRIGQETGDLATAVQRVAAMTEDKFEITVQRVFAILEPTIILLVSLFVAAIIVSIIGAVISVNDLIV